MNKRVTILCLVILCLTLCGCKDASTQGLEVGQDKVNNGQEVGGKVEQAAPELLAHALNLDDCEPERSKKSFQDICSYLGRRAEEWTGEYRKLELKEEEREALRDYINLLINEFNYEIVDSYHYDATAEDPFGEYFLGGSSI